MTIFFEKTKILVHVHCTSPKLELVWMLTKVIVCMYSCCWLPASKLMQKSHVQNPIPHDQFTFWHELSLNPVTKLLLLHSEVVVLMIHHPFDLNEPIKKAYEWMHREALSKIKYFDFIQAEVYKYYFTSTVHTVMEK